MKQHKTLTIFLCVAFLFSIQIAKAQETPEWVQATQFGVLNGPGGVGVGVFDFEMDSQSNYYLVGGYNNVLQGEGFSCNSIPTWNDGNSYILKYDINGNYLWHKAISVNEAYSYETKDIIYAIAVDDNNDIYITGRYNQSLDFGDGITLSTGLDQSTMFLAKINADGTAAWAKGITPGAGANYSEGNDITIDQEGIVLCAGSFDNTVSFDGGTTSITACQGGTDQEDIFIAKYNPDNGDFISVIQAGGAEDEYVYGITTDSDNNYYIFGRFQAYAVFGDITINETPGGNYDRYIAKCTPDGTFTDAILIGSTGYYGIDNYNSIDCDNNNNIYIADEAVKDNIYFDENNIVNASYDHRFGYFAKYNSNLKFQWGELFECSYGGMSVPVSPSSFNLDQNGNAYVIGYYQESIDFGNGISLDDPSAENVTSSFIVKYDISGDEPNAIWADQAINDPISSGGNIGRFIGIYNNYCFMVGNYSNHTLTLGGMIINRNYEDFQMNIFIATDFIIPPTIQSAEVLEDGLTIEATFDKEMTLDGQTAPAGFSIGVENPIIQFHLKNGEPETIVYYLTNTITSNDEVFLNYTPGTIESLDKGELETITNYPVQNNSVVTTISETNNQLIIYPNPSNGIFKLSGYFQIYPYGPESLKITNITGKTIYTSAISDLQTERQIDLSNQPKGIYFIKIETGDGTHTEKLIIH